MSFGPHDWTDDDPANPFAFRRNYGGVHPFKEGERAVANDCLATVVRAYWHMGKAMVELRFDEKPDTCHSWGAERVRLASAVDLLGGLV